MRGRSFLIFAGLFLQGLPVQALDLVVVQQGSLGDLAECSQGRRKAKTISVSLPKAQPHAYSHTSIQKQSENGNAWVKTSYDSESQTVTITVETQAHNECSSVGGLINNEPRSWIDITYTVYAIKNECDPLVALPNEAEVAAHTYAKALEQRRRGVECLQQTTAIKKREALLAFQERVTALAKARYREKSLEVATRIAEVQVARSEARFLRDRLRDLHGLILMAASALRSLKMEAEKPLDLGFGGEAAARQAVLRWHQERRERYEKLMIFQKEKPLLYEQARRSGSAVFRPVEKPFVSCSPSRKFDAPSLQYSNLRDALRRVSESLKDWDEYGRQLESVSRVLVVDLQKEFELGSLRSLVEEYRTRGEQIYEKSLVDRSKAESAASAVCRVNQLLLERALRDSPPNLFHDLPEVGQGGTFGGGLSVPDILKPISPFPTPFPSPITGGPVLMRISGVSMSAKNSQICLMMETEVSFGSQMMPRPERDGLSFVKVNGHPIAFYLVKGSERYENGQLVRSRSQGCLQSSHLKMRSNAVALSFRYGQGQYLSGSERTSIYSGFGSSRQHLLCSTSVSGGTQGSRGCSGSLVMDLDEFDPDLHETIQGLRQELRRMELSVRADQDDLARLKKGLARFEGTDIDALSTEELRGFSQELDKLATAIETLRFKLEVDREQIVAEVREILGDDSIQFRVDLERAGGDSRGDLLNETVIGRYAKVHYELVEAEMAAYLNGDKEQAPSEVLAGYEKMAREIVRLLEESVRSAEFVRADELLKSWKRTKTELYERLTARRAGVKELEAFKAAVQRADAGIAIHFDENGFFRKADIPVDIRLKLARLNTKFADEMRIALNERAREHGDVQAKEMRLAFRLWLRAYLELYEGGADAQGLSFEERQTIESIEGGLLAVVKSGFAVGVSLTPFGKFLDFCEMVSGRELCQPKGRVLDETERALAGIGLVVGSGLLTKKIAQSAFVRESRLIASLIEGLNGAVRRLAVKLKSQTQDGTDLARRLMRFLRPKSVSGRQAAEIVALSEKAVIKHLANFKNIRVEDARKLNEFWKKTRGWEAPWDEAAGVFSGELVSETVFVRFYSSVKQTGWMLPAETVRGLSPEQIRSVLAMAVVPTHYTRVVVPAGEIVQMGRVAPNKFGGLERMIQFHLVKTRPSFYFDERKIGEIFRGLE